MEWQHSPFILPLLIAGLITFITAAFAFRQRYIFGAPNLLVLEKLESGVLVLDRQNRVVEINATAVSLLQKEKKALLGKPLTFNQPQWAGLADALQEEHAAKIELSLDQAYYEASVVMLENRRGEANGRLITLHNITQRKESELLLQQQTKEAAKAADLTKTYFFTNVSHEIRTPLNAIVGMTEMLRQTPLNANQIEMIDIITRSGDDLVSLINNILDFAKLEADNITLNQHSFELVDCIESALDSVSQAASKKELHLTYQINEEVPLWLLGDPIRLRQILVNLLENGIKFTDEGSVELSVAHSYEAGDAVLQFAVKDSGIGIADDQIQHLFSPFRQVDGSLTRMHGGNGLGLVICKRLVGLMGGDIHLHSQIGQGTAVHFTARFGVATEAQPPAVRLRQHKATLAHKRLLVITKDASERRRINKEARTAGLEVYAAASAQEATYWINNSHTFDVALVDAAIWQEEPSIINQLHHKDTLLPLPTILLVSDNHSQFNLADTYLFSGSLSLPIVSSQMYDMLLNVLSTGNVAVPNPEQGQAMANRYPLTILIVEDNDLNRRVLKNMLHKLGYRADVAINGQLATQAAAQKKYDVILMDIQMPVMDGIEATRHILAACSQDERPYIITITAHALEGDREYYLASGMNEYISKPITMNQLVEALYQAVNYHDLFARSSEFISTSPEVNEAEEQSSASAPAIDLVELEKLVGEDTHGFLQMMAPIFREDTQHILQKMAAAVQHMDNQEIRHAAHTLKGSSASMAMTKLSHLCRELEMNAKENELATASQKLEQIQAEYNRVEATLIEMFETAV